MQYNYINDNKHKVEHIEVLLETCTENVFQVKHKVLNMNK